MQLSAIADISKQCAGIYCGRINEDGNISDCQACPRGYRPDESSVCQKCTSEPIFYDWLYLGFMALLAPALHCFFIDFTNKRKSRGLLILHISAVVECTLAGISAILICEPLGSFNIYSCPVQYLSDWYTMLYNPKPDYTQTIYCTQEVVYPLYSMVMVYYAFCIAAMMILRPLLSIKFVHGRGTKSVYAALYFLPMLVVVQAVLAGLLYYCFPFIILVGSVITSAAHFAYFEEQEVKYLIKRNIRSFRNMTILLCHWLMHGFSIIAVTELKDPVFHGTLLCLVPFPSLFYLMTVKFTDPFKIKSQIHF